MIFMTLAEKRNIFYTLCDLEESMTLFKSILPYQCLLHSTTNVIALQRLE